MQPRLDYFPQFPKAFQKLNELEGVLKESSLDPLLKHLVKIRASQVNGCAFCVDMHSKEAVIGGERTLRLLHLPVWEESPLFSDRERAALRWTESVTRLSQGAVSDSAFAEVRERFSEKELTELTLVIAVINAWNRFGATFRSVPGSLDRAYGLEKAGL